MNEPGLRARSAFPCQHETCSDVAAMVEVIARGQSYSEGSEDIISRVFPSASGTIRITGFLQFANFSTTTFYLAATMRAVREVDAAALHSMDREWTPFYCRTCARSFCGYHWRLTPTFDFGFDYYSGTCPVGHPHFIDH